MKITDGAHTCQYPRIPKPPLAVLSTTPRVNSALVHHRTQETEQNTSAPTYTPDPDDKLDTIHRMVDSIRSSGDLDDLDNAPKHALVRRLLFIYRNIPTRKLPRI